jgi:putative membrane protein
VFVFSAPFVFTTGFKWLSPVPSTIVAVAFYGVAEVARSIEDPYTWEQPSHDLSHVGWRLYVESLELHEQSVVDAGDTRMGKQSQLTCDGGAGIFLGSGGVKTVLRNGPDSVPSVSLGDVTVVDLTVVADIGDGGVTSVVTKTIDAKIDASTRPVSAAHGAADRALVFAGRPDPEQETAKAFARIAAAGKSVDDTSADDLKPGKTVGNGNEHAEGSQEESPCLKLSSSKFGFFTDVFRVKGTVHGEGTAVGVSQIRRHAVLPLTLVTVRTFR